jgi:hypothetical protein
MDESPVFAKAKSREKQVHPLKESFGNRYNMKFVLLALFGATMGQGVVWYTGQFYAMNFMKTVMSIDSLSSGYFIRSCFNSWNPIFRVFWLVK